MANWAIVIGINQYDWTPSASLKGAVRDALQMRNWLLDVKGGNVPAQNLFLLLAPSTEDTLPPNLQYYDTTQGRMIEVVNRLVQQSGSQGERLFFYYAGHGLTARINFSDEQALIPSDFTDLLTIQSLSLRSILEYFDTTQFTEQFFFIDACRNIPWDGEFRIGYWPVPQRRDPSLPSNQRFVFYATSPGVKAAEILEEVGNERGVFTQVLLDGLNGKGGAKAWNMESDEYVVRALRLFKFVKVEVSNMLALVTDDKARKLIQPPTWETSVGGSVGDDNPILARFPVNAFPSETLDVFVEPSDIAPQAEVSVLRESFRIASQKEITTQPVKFVLQPKEYTIQALASNYESKRQFIELYTPRKETIFLAPRQPIIQTEPPEISLPQPHEPQPPGKLILEAADPLAPLELADSTGKILSSGIQSTIKNGKHVLECSNLMPGFYRARLITPEGEIVEEVVDLSPGDTKEVQLHAPKLSPTRLSEDLIKGSYFDVDSQNALHISEEMGPLMSAQLSTILAVAGKVVTYDENRLGAHRLRGLGLKSFMERVPPGTPSGLQILFGSEYDKKSEALEYLSGIKLRFWDFRDVIPSSFDQPIPFSPVEGLREFSYPSLPSPHWLSVELPNQKPVVFALTMLPDRMTMLIFHRHIDSQVRIFQYLPSLHPDDVDEYPDRRLIDYRRLDLLQRFYLSGRLDHAYENAWELLRSKWLEPISGCLGGYLLLKMGKVSELQIAVSNMTAYFSELSDSHILRGEYIASQGNVIDAAKEFSKALDVGLPIFSEGLLRLFDAIHSYNIIHPRGALLAETVNKHTRGLLWSAWIPDSLSPGNLVH